MLLYDAAISVLLDIVERVKINAIFLMKITISAFTFVIFNS